MVRSASRHRVALVVVVALFESGCGDERQASVAVNPTNALSALVSFRADAEGEARVLYRSRHSEGATPFFPVAVGSNELPVLGLDESTKYSFTVEMADDPEALPAGGLKTGSLPVQLQLLDLRVDGSLSSELVLLNYPDFVLALDEAGTVRWYRGFDDYVGRDAGQKANGNFVAFIGRTTGSLPLPGHYTEFTPAGRVVREYRAAEGYYVDNHELLLTDFDDGAEPTAHLFTLDVEEGDVSDVGGSSSVAMTAHQIVRSKGDEVLFEWDARDHFEPSDATFLDPDAFVECDKCELDHPNSLAIDDEGHYVASWLSLSEVNAIDFRTGDILWRLGGANNDFTFVDDPRGGFSGSHSVSVLDGGHLLLYDNALDRPELDARAVEYALDLDTMTATMVWQYAPEPPRVTPIVGTVQRLANGNTFIAFTGTLGPGEEQLLVEVNDAGDVLWEARFVAPSIVYRALPVESLYRFEPP